MKKTIFLFVEPQGNFLSYPHHRQGIDEARIHLRRRGYLSIIEVGQFSYPSMRALIENIKHENYHVAKLTFEYAAKKEQITFGIGFEVLYPLYREAIGKTTAIELIYEVENAMIKEYDAKAEKTEKKEGVGINELIAEKILGEIAELRLMLSAVLERTKCLDNDWVSLTSPMQSMETVKAENQEELPKQHELFSENNNQTHEDNATDYDRFTVWQNSQLLYAREAAEFLGFSVATLYRYTNQGAMKCVSGNGRLNRWSIDELLNFKKSYKIRKRRKKY